MYDPNIPVNLAEDQYKGVTDTWKPVEDTSNVPQYVKDALLRDLMGGTGQSATDLMKNAKLGTFTLNGQQNYGFMLPSGTILQPGRYETVGAESERWVPPDTVQSDAYYGIPVPFAPNTADYRSNYLMPTLKGQTITGQSGTPQAYTFGEEGAYFTPEMVNRAVKNEQTAAKLRAVRPTDLLMPLVPVALGLGAGALGSAFGLGEAGAGAGAAGAGSGFASTAAEFPGALTIGASDVLPASAAAGGWDVAAAAPAATGAFDVATAPAISLGGAVPLTEAGTIAPSAAAAGGSGGIMGAISGVNNTITSGIQSGLEAIGLSPETAASVAPVASKAVLGAAGNAAVSGLTGGDPLKGALTGALTGGALGAFGGPTGALASSLGISPSIADMIIGGAAGGLGAAATGQNPILGGLSGVGAGAINTALSGADGSTGTGNWGSGSVVDGVYVPPAGASLAGSSVPIASGSGASSIFGEGGKGINGTALALGALATGASMLGGNKSKTATPSGSNTGTPGPESVSANLGSYWNQPLATVSSGRTAVNPWFGSTPSYWDYGGPERTYFTNNSLKAYGFAEGGMINGVQVDSHFDQGGQTPLGLAEGGPLQRVFSTKGGQHYVEGPGDGQSDDIPAALSDGEFVWDASTVARIGNGSSKRGGAILEAARRAIAKDAGSKTVVQKPIKKSPLHYIAEAAR